MIICGSLNSNKTELLIEQYVQLINNGECPENILFITLNSFKKEKILKSINAFYSNINPTVHTYLGLCYNAILDNENILLTQISKSKKENLTLCGLEVSQNLLLDAIKIVGFKDYNSKINLVHQLLRRHALIVNNNLSEKEIDEKSLILKEEFAQEAKKAIELFKAKTVELKAFDYLRQQSLFKWIYQNTNYCSKFKYIFIDDFDEQIPSCIDFFKHIKPNLQDYFIGIDPKGSTRIGYLCADLNSTNILKENTLKITAKEPTQNINIEFFKYTKRLEMLSAITTQIDKLLKEGTAKDEISIITPVFDNQLKFVLKNHFDKTKTNIQMISGSEKLSDDVFIKSILNLLKLINNTEKNIFANTDILNNVFPTLLNIPQKKSIEIIKIFQKNKGFIKHDFKDEKTNASYNRFLDTAISINCKISLEEQLDKIYKEIIAYRKTTEEELSNFLFLKKQIKDLEETDIYKDKKKILNQIGNSIISENDVNGLEIKKHSIIIGTPQKIIDYEIKTKYQFWLDISNDEWIKQDTGTIYNAWVFAKAWNKNSFTYEDSLKCVEEKTKRILRKLKLLTNKKIFAYSSTYNSFGIDNNIGLTQLLKEKKDENQEKIKTKIEFTPRIDQKKIFDYKSGKMALSAVPGAGKTTVLQALILKLIDEGTAPENIFVLTYMDSAAKTLKDRLLNAMDSNSQDPDILPNISTIHGLALRIIKENANFSKVNLDENFEICDEIFRQKIIRDSIGELNLNYDDYEKFDKGISIAKFVHINSKTQSKEIKEFLELYKKYQTKLSEKNLIDYDDMLILAVKILEENPQVLTYYQNICKYILEDEAQDSSEIQQKLISLLAGKHKNIIRCGDINQAITSTFTNSDIKGFKNFIKNNFSVEMTYSQRCTKEIFTLANKLIDFSKEKIINGENAFYEIKMLEVEGKNPVSNNAINSKIFEHEQEEQTYIIDNIKNILQSNNEASIAILVRNNFQVSKYSTLLKENGFPVLSRSDCLEQNKIFNIILSLLKFCTYPWKNNLVQNAYKHIYNIKEENIFLENLEEPFINTDASTLNDENLIKLHWELNYWLNQNSMPIEQLALKIGEYYCDNDLIMQSNLFIISELIRRFTSTSNSNTEIISKLEQVSKKPTIAGLKLFSYEDSGLKTLKGGSIQIMTMHKSKGDEFDYVFIPELTEKNLGTDFKSIKIGNNSGFFEDIKSLERNYTHKNATELKQEILHENLRLLYVAITRAKKKIFFTVSQKQNIFGRNREVEISNLFNTFLNNIF